MLPGAEQIHHEQLAMTFDTSIRPSSSSSSSHPPSLSSLADYHGWRQGGRFRPSTNGSPTSIVININDGGSTSRGFLIGILSAFGSAGIAVLILAIFFFFKYTNRGRIILDRIGRPGEFDDEQAFAQEEAEALESMDELQRIEYLRAKGTYSTSPVRSSLGCRPLIDKSQHLQKQIRRNQCRPIYPCRNSSRSKKRGFPPGNSSQNLKLPIVL